MVYAPHWYDLNGLIHMARGKLRLMYRVFLGTLPSSCVLLGSIIDAGRIVAGLARVIVILVYSGVTIMDYLPQKAKDLPQADKVLLQDQPSHHLFW